MSDNPFASGDNPFSGDASPNPYQAPTVASLASDVSGSDPSLGRVAEMLRQTKPWVRFMSVMLFIGAALLVLGGLVIMASGAAEGPVPGLGRVGAVLGFIYIVMAVLYIAPGVFLWMYADRIGVFLRQRTPGTLASALEAQKSFWKFVGIATLIVICLYCLGIIVFVVFVGGAATMMR
jgi:hypothetical protein